MIASLRVMLPKEECHDLLWEEHVLPSEIPSTFSLLLGTQNQGAMSVIRMELLAPPLHAQLHLLSMVLHLLLVNQTPQPAKKYDKKKSRQHINKTADKNAEEHFKSRHYVNCSKAKTNKRRSLQS
jgi:hypothetical protein